jgi:hypothetical protein
VVSLPDQPALPEARTCDLHPVAYDDSLCTGKETDGHDRDNMTMLDLLEWDHQLAHLTYNFGIVLMLTSFVWGASPLLRHYRRLSP